MYSCRTSEQLTQSMVAEKHTVAVIWPRTCMGHDLAAAASIKGDKPAKIVITAFQASTSRR